jgi:hypothetical protein
VFRNGNSDKTVFFWKEKIQEEWGWGIARMLVDSWRLSVSLAMAVDF